MQNAAPVRAPRITSQQITIYLLLFLGYAGYYICRSYFAVIKSSLMETQGLDKAALGTIASIGTTCYAIGKFGNGIATDFIGGKRIFLFGMIGSILCTVLFGLGSGFGFFLVVWAANRLIQSMGWGGLVKVASHWTPHANYGRVMGFLSLSFLLGDAVARWILGELLEWGLTWRGLLFTAAGILGVIALRNLFLLRDHPQPGEIEEVSVSPTNVFGEQGKEDNPPGLWELLRPFFTSGSFWVVLILSFGLTLIRETFNEWLPLYFQEVLRVSAGEAAKRAAIFPLSGAVSALIVGWLTDRFFGGRRGVVMALALTLAVFALICLSMVRSADSASTPMILSALVGLLVIGPYSFLAGAIALDIGGKRGSSTSAGLIDSAGYLGGIFSGYAIGSIAKAQGWGAAYNTLAGVCAVCAVTAFLYWRFCERRR